MTHPAGTMLGGDRLTSAAVRAVAGGALVDLDPRAPARMVASYEFAQRLIAEGTPVYGLTTGCGPLAAHSVSSEHREAFQRNLVRSHANTLGAPQSTERVRAAIAARAHVLALGRSAVDPYAVELLLRMLNEGIHPVVREVGAVGASGDLLELAEIALAAMGEGTVEFDERIRPAAEVFAELGIRPVVPRIREGLALMNGTSFQTATAALLVGGARAVVSAALVGAAMAFEGLRGKTEAFDAALQDARAHPGQRRVAERLDALLDGSRLTRHGNSARGQDAYTLRCIPQVMGAVLDHIEHAAGIVETELNSVTDNPLFLAAEERVVHGGNFHGQPVAMALDQLKIALVEVGVVCERRLARLLDEQLSNGLPPFLTRGTPGVDSGFMGLQYCASSMAADNAVLAAPASVRSVPTNANNQDIVGMGMVAAGQAARVLDNVERMVAIEIVCAGQALDLRGPNRAAPGTRAAHARLREHVAPLDADRPVGEEVERVAALVRAGAFDGGDER